MTTAETKLAALIDAGATSPTGHASPSAFNRIILSSMERGQALGAVRVLVLVELDGAGVPQMNEQWIALPFPDGSMLACTPVRGRGVVEFWKALPNLAGFEVCQEAFV